MATMPKLKITYTQNNAEVTHEVKIVFADMVKWDVLRKRFDFPAQDEAQSTWMAVLAFSALVRAGLVPSTTNAPEFLESIVMIEPVDEDPEAAEFPAVTSN